MIPVNFPEANITYGPPPGFEAEQVTPIRAYRGQAAGGSVDGVDIVVVAWQPSDDDLVILKQGGVVYLSVIGGLPAHFLTTDFHAATHPS